MCSLRCLNCGAMLKGKYCHECGQQVTTKMPSVKDFILEYLNNAFIFPCAAPTGTDASKINANILVLNENPFINTVMTTDAASYSGFYL